MLHSSTSSAEDRASGPVGAVCTRRSASRLTGTVCAYACLRMHGGWSVSTNGGGAYLGRAGSKRLKANQLAVGFLLQAAARASVETWPTALCAHVPPPSQKHRTRRTNAGAHYGAALARLLLLRLPSGATRGWHVMQTQARLAHDRAPPHSQQHARKRRSQLQGSSGKQVAGRGQRRPSPVQKMQLGKG